MLNFFNALIPLIVIHVICDFYLQPKSWVDAKRESTYRAIELYFHSVLHGVALIIPAFILGLGVHSTVCLVAIVMVTHYLFDLGKAMLPNGEKLGYFILDQFFHVLVLVFIAYHMSDNLTLDALLNHKHFFDAIFISLGYLIALKPTSIIIASVLKRFPLGSSGQGEGFAASEADSDAVSSAAASGIAAGGELIGYLERVLILTFTIAGSYAAIGFVFAAKSIFRFGELNKSEDRSMTEYVLIGSLLSVVITTVIGTLISLGLGIKIK